MPIKTSRVKRTAAIIAVAAIAASAAVVTQPIKTSGKHAASWSSHAPRKV